MRHLVCILTLFTLQACTVIDNKVSVVDNFDVKQYMGNWYEIARLDHSFERGMDKVTANYQLQDNKVIVTNKGFNHFSNQWDQAIGKAYFIEEENKGLLKVSFFGPFYGSYVIFYLDENYQHAFVSGPDTSYLWFLSRTPSVSADDIINFIDKANSYGFDTTKLIFVKQMQDTPFSRTVKRS